MPSLLSDFHVQYLEMSICESIVSPLFENFQNCHNTYSFLIQLFLTNTDFTASYSPIVQIFLTVTTDTHFLHSKFPQNRYYYKLLICCSNFCNCNNIYSSLIIIYIFHKYSFFCKFTVHYSHFQNCNNTYLFLVQKF
jgi:hypothetical protein